MATIEQMVRARATYNGQDPEAAWGQFSGAQGLPYAPAPTAPVEAAVAAPVPVAPPVEPAPVLEQPVAPAPVAVPAPVPLTAVPPTPAAGPRPMDQVNAAMGDVQDASMDQQQAYLDAETARQSMAPSRDAAADAYGESLRQDMDASKQSAAKFDEQSQKIIDDMKALEAKAASMQVVDRRSTTQKAMGMIGLALSAASDGFAATGGVTQNNYGAMQAHLDKVVADDMDRQREQIAGVRGQAAAKLTELGLARATFKDQRDADAYAALMRKDAYATEMEKYANKAKDADARARTLAGVAAIREDTAQGRAAFFGKLDAQQRSGGTRQLTEKEQLQNELLRISIDKARREAETGPTDSPDLAYRKAHDAKEISNREAMRAIDGLEPTRPLGEVSDDAAKKARESHIMYGNLKKNLAKMQKIATSQSGIDANKEFDLLQQQTVAMATQAAGSGVPGATEAIKFAAGMPAPNYVGTWSIEDREKIYQGAIDTADTLHKNTVQAYGYDIAKPKKSGGDAAPTTPAAPSPASTRTWKPGDPVPK